MLFNSLGHRMASSDILRRLGQVHPALGMVWLPVGRWALTYAWPPDDHRRIKVQLGQLGGDACYDLWGIAPEAMKDEDAYGFLVRTLQRNSGTKAAAREMLDRVYAYNKGVEDQRVGEGVDYAEEEFRVHAPTVFEPLGKSISRVYVTDRRVKR